MEDIFITCLKCGINNKEGTSFCVNCGNNISEVKEFNQTQFNQPQQNYTQPPPGYSHIPHDYNQPQYNYYNQYSEIDDTVTVGEWMIMLLIFCIPLVNIIMMFVWAFGSGAKKSKSSFCKATLIFAAIFFILSILSYITFGSIYGSIYYF